MRLQESGEMYLESILVLSQKAANVRAIDICEYRCVSKPSVSRAVGLLKDGGYINVAADGALTLTDEGYRVASKIYERHTVITELLCNIGVDEKIAAEDACKVEHVISDETFAAIKKAIKK